MAVGGVEPLSPRLTLRHSTARPPLLTAIQPIGIISAAVWCEGNHQNLINIHVLPKSLTPHRHHS